MRHVRGRFERHANDIVGRAMRQISDKADATGVMLDFRQI
jgi:hypothetical protein